MSGKVGSVKKIYPKLLKKMTVQGIKQLREEYRQGRSIAYLAKKYDIAETTVSWHLGGLQRPEYLEIE